MRGLSLAKPISGDVTDDLIKEHLDRFKPIAKRYEKEKSEDPNALRTRNTQSSR